MTTFREKQNPVCPLCGGKTQLRRRKPYMQYQCMRKGCKKFFSMPSPAHVTRERNSMIVTTEVHRIMSDLDLLKYLNVDMKEWEITKVEYGKSDGWRKDKKTEHHVRNGKIIRSDVSDSGKILIVPMFSVKVFLSRKVEEKRANLAIEELMKKAKRHAPKYTKIRYTAPRDSMLYEIEMPDLHLGLLAWAQETGKDADIKLETAMALQAVDELLAYAHLIPVRKILLPLGNDFFNVNDKTNTTVHGTPQQEDTRWQKTYVTGCQLAVQIIDRCSRIAPVDVVVVPGNHDEERTFYMGHALEFWYNSNPNVNVDNRAIPRKYYHWERNLIGLTHGYYENVNNLSALMPQEKPLEWAASDHREWHLGDKHHKKDMVTTTEELNNGVVIRLLRSLTAPSAWSFSKGFVGARRSAEAFVWHPTKGVVGQFTSSPQ